MKTSIKILFLSLFMSLPGLTGCETEEPDNRKDDGLAFHAMFSVCCTGSLPNEARMDNPPKVHYLQGKGVEAGLGEFTVRMQLCGIGSDAEHPCCGPYTVAAGKFILGNGDELCFSIPEGQILANEGDEYFQMKLNDLMLFEGGKGRFAGAKGQASTQGLIHVFQGKWEADFEVEGRLLLQAALAPYATGRENESVEKEVERFEYRTE